MAMNHRWVMWTIWLAAVVLIIWVGKLILTQTYVLLSGLAPQLLPATWAVSEPWKTASFYWIVSFCITLLYLSWHYRRDLFVGETAGSGTRSFLYGLLASGVIGYVFCIILAAAARFFPPGLGALNRGFSVPVVRLLTILSGDRLIGVGGAFSAVIWFLLLAVIFSLIASAFYRLIERYETTFEEEEAESE